MNLSNQTMLLWMMGLFQLVSSCNFTTYKSIQTEIPIQKILQGDTIVLGYIEGTNTVLSSKLTGYLEHMLAQCDNLHYTSVKQTDSLLQIHRIYGFPREFIAVFLKDLAQVLPSRYFLRSTLVHWRNPKLDKPVDGARVGIVFQLFDLQTKQIICQSSGVEEGSVWGDGTSESLVTSARTADAQFLYLLRDIFIFNNNKGFCNWIKPKN